MYIRSTKRPLSQKLFIGLSGILFEHPYSNELLNFLEIGEATGVISGVAIRACMKDIHTRGSPAPATNDSKTFEILRMKSFTNLSFNLLSTLPLQNSITAIKQKVTEMIHFMALPVFDSTLKLSHRCEAVLFAERLVRSIED